MPGLIEGAQGSKKRKNPAKETLRESNSSKRRVIASEESEDEAKRIENLENQISESQKHYNNIATLISMLENKQSPKQPNLAVMVSLCRVFCRLTATGKMKEPQKATEQEKILTAWLKERCHEYQNSLLTCIREADSSSQITGLTLCLRLIQARATNVDSESQEWLSGFFSDVFGAMISSENGEALRSEFVQKFMQEYDDIRFHTLWQISKYASTERSPQILDRLIALLTSCDPVPTAEHAFTKFYSTSEKKEKSRKNSVLSVASHKKRAQDAWLAVLRNGLDESQRKKLLRIMSHTIAPWFTRPELLMDFLTDSYNSGGSTSLLALSGLFYLIQEKNLDYPQFYTKLYSLLDSELLHSKYRSRFFRLLDTFLSSSHLPVTLVASFIKRLSRLALYAPPSAIVAVVPFIYNMIKNHPTCAFMIHRALDPQRKAEVEADGMDDPFDPEQPDPTLTCAIDSSLWEIETLQTHYHPNVSFICKILGEQFTKQAYNLEDFLDYTYQGMITAELGAEEKTSFKKAPVVEFHIPKRIFTNRLLEEDGGHDTAPGALLRDLWAFS